MVAGREHRQIPMYVLYAKLPHLLPVQWNQLNHRAAWKHAALPGIRWVHWALASGRKL